MCFSFPSEWEKKIQNQFGNGIQIYLLPTQMQLFLADDEIQKIVRSKTNEHIFFTWE